MKELLKLSELILQVELSSLQSLIRDEAALAQQVDLLKRGARERAASLLRSKSPDAASFAGADQRRSVWLEQNLAVLNTQRAGLLGNIQERKGKSKKAFGRCEALKAICQESAAQKRILAKRRIR